MSPNMTVEGNDPVPDLYRGFKIPKPDGLPISTKVWSTALRYDTGGPTVVRALFDAVVELETELIALRRKQSD